VGRHNEVKILIVLLGSLAWSQSFEAASIKLNNSGRAGQGISTYPARIKVINSSLKLCIQMAWNVKDFQVSGTTGWMDTEHYDIDAVAAEPFKKDEYREMLKTLLAERFGLAIHTEMQDKAGFALVVAKNGSKLPPLVEDPSVQFSRTPSGDVMLKAPNVSMAQLASALSMMLSGIVVDKTGIEGRFNASFQWTPDQPMRLKSGEPAPAPPPDATPGPSIFTAIQEKLGLRLESRKVPTEVIVIDRAQRPSEN
jgi:uncharacterized protein (TIGR03435 family)